MNESELRFAILIDADNVSEKYIKIILDEIANAGVATYKRIYGDWTSTRMTTWKSVLLDYSIIPMQQYSYTSGKNATDSAMIIDAMDILYSGNVDGFAIVSSDSDFTRLVARLRESGKQVIGMGEQKTPKPFISACNQFKYLDILFTEEQKQQAAEEAAQKRQRRRNTASDTGADATTHESSEDDENTDEEVAFGEMSRADRRRHLAAIRSSIAAIIDAYGDEDGWVTLGQLGDQLSRRLPDFDVRNYGFKRLRPFLKSLGVYEFYDPEGAYGLQQIYIRERDED
ncbi:NYN domain-containing protein [Collinsella sp. AGMB00827]|uniref:NYN domain-containing protein n=1 Tax=Collinsella ureilytica TaxID=2869515 RepID=A0ABS7MHI2_9ACTN|nr:NYN domain-containing protein [Collinsella urealyticum]MBY4796804.1 NYN domain-containing protein [Collinsella urealyticum]